MEKRLGFRPSLRLKKRIDFLRVQSRGRKFSSPSFTLLVLVDELGGKRNQPPGVGVKFGVTVSTKIDKRAVIRNRIRRRLKELFRLNQALFQEIAGERALQVVAIARPAAIKSSFAALRNEMVVILKNLSSR